MLIQIINGNILTPNGWLKGGSLIIGDDKIIDVTNCELAIIGAKIVDAKGMHIVPGFVETYAFGGGGFNFKDLTAEAYEKAALSHLRHGVTTFYPTIAAMKNEDIKTSIRLCEEAMTNPDTTIEGLHIKGPYLNPNMESYQLPGVLREIDEEEYKELVESTNCIKRWDISPELEGSEKFARFVTSHGILASITHTEAKYPQVKAAFEAGFTHASHFYNAMPGFRKQGEYKYEGTVESVYLMDDMTVELIADGIHLPPTILRLVHKIKGVEKIALVSNALRYAGTDITLVQKKDENLIIEGGVYKLADQSSLVGGMVMMDDMIKVIVEQTDISLQDTIRMASETPARLMNIYDRKGSLERGKDADVVILDKELKVRSVWNKGKQVTEAQTLFDY